MTPRSCCHNWLHGLMDTFSHLTVKSVSHPVTFENRSPITSLLRIDTHCIPTENRYPSHPLAHILLTTTLFHSVHTFSSHSVDFKESFESTTQYMSSNISQVYSLIHLFCCVRPLGGEITVLTFCDGSFYILVDI